MTLAEFIQKQKEHEEARETLRQEQTYLDDYLNHIHLIKQYRDDPVMRSILNQGNAEALTANQMSKIAMKAVALNYDKVTKWIEGRLHLVKLLLGDLQAKKLTE